MSFELHSAMGLVILRLLAWVASERRSAALWPPLLLGTLAQLGLAIEARILVRPFIPRLTRSELFTVMCVGLGGVAGTVLVHYAGLLADTIPNAAGHLLVASVITVPASIVIARTLIPEVSAPMPGSLQLPADVPGSIDAVTHGTRQGLELFLNIVATLLVFVALVHLLNALLGLLPDWHGIPLSLERIAGWVFAPIAWLIGIPGVKPRQQAPCSAPRPC